MIITGPQFRAARAMLGWTVRELARRAIVSVATINAIEDTNVPSSHRRGAAIQMALEEDGIEFTNGDESGVKLKAKPKVGRSDDASSPTYGQGCDLVHHHRGRVGGYHRFADLVLESAMTDTPTPARAAALAAFKTAPEEYDAMAAL
jgi:hypothetical protein